MNKSEFLKMVSEYDGYFKGWRIETEKMDMSDFVLGCYYDQNQGKWIVYINKSQGRHYVRMVTNSEEEAFNELCSIMDFRYNNLV